MAEFRDFQPGGTLPTWFVNQLQDFLSGLVVAGRKGLSRESVVLFERTQRAGGRLVLRSVSREMRARVDDLALLVRDELAPAGLASLRDGIVEIAAGFEAAVVFDHGWSRWAEA